MKVEVLEDGRPVIILERNEIKEAQRVLSLIRCKTIKGEQDRTWAFVKLDCVRRARP
jgi:hypothetical protein